MSYPALFLILAQASTGRTYPDAAIYFFGAIVLIAFGVILLFEGLDAVRAALRALARRLRGDNSVADLTADLAESDLEEEGEGVQLTEPDSKLRRRHFRRLRPVRRTWEGSHTNDTSRHWRGRTSL